MIRILGLVLERYFPPAQGREDAHGAVQRQPALVGVILHPGGCICLGEAVNRHPGNTCCPHGRQLSMPAALRVQAEPEQTIAGRTEWGWRYILT